MGTPARRRRSVFSARRARSGRELAFPRLFAGEENGPLALAGLVLLFFAGPLAALAVLPPREGDRLPSSLLHRHLLWANPWPTAACLAAAAGLTVWGGWLRRARCVVRVEPTAGGHRVSVRTAAFGVVRRRSGPVAAGGRARVPAKLCDGAGPGRRAAGGVLIESAAGRVWVAPWLPPRPAGWAADWLNRHLAAPAEFPFDPLAPPPGVRLVNPGAGDDPLVIEFPRARTPPPRFAGGPGSSGSASPRPPPPCAAGWRGRASPARCRSRRRSRAGW